MIPLAIAPGPANPLKIAPNNGKNINPVQNNVKNNPMLNSNSFFEVDCLTDAPQFGQKVASSEHSKPHLLQIFIIIT